MSINYKIILIGNTGVGKEIIIKKLTSDEFPENNIGSIGVIKKSIYLGININENGIETKKCFDISLFDTAGQEKFRSLTFNYLKPNHGSILIYDITNRNSFYNVEGWINDIQKCFSQDESKHVSFLIGNKSELIKNGEKERQVTEEEAKKLCDKYHIIWGGEINLKELELNETLKLMEKFVLDIYKIVGVPEIKKQTVLKASYARRRKKQDKKCIIY